jgi:uncharacterized protein YecE (DUF72 family)
MTKRGKFWVGTSGWSYMHWIGPFYAPELRPDEFLKYYVERFNTTEINSTFYRLPKAETVRRWRTLAPPCFIYSVKANRQITHVKRLIDPKDTIPPFLERMSLLKEKLGPILFQLPPSMKFDLERLGAFLDALDGAYLWAFELRNKSWFDDRTFDLLRRHNAAMCLYDFEGLRPPEVITANFIYIRLHGPEVRYRGSYSQQFIESLANKICRWTDDGYDVFCYFDNDEAGYAAINALQLSQLVTRQYSPTL